jgi:hypothetical protein
VADSMPAVSCLVRSWLHMFASIHPGRPKSSYGPIVNLSMSAYKLLGGLCTSGYLMQGTCHSRIDHCIVESTGAASEGWRRELALPPPPEIKHYSELQSGVTTPPMPHRREDCVGYVGAKEIGRSFETGKATTTTVNPSFGLLLVCEGHQCCISEKQLTVRALQPEILRLKSNCVVLFVPLSPARRFPRLAELPSSHTACSSAHNFFDFCSGCRLMLCRARQPANVVW